MFLSTILAFSSSSWVTIWIMMEVNTLAMCTMLSKESNKMNKKLKSTMIYLIIQMLASMVFLLSVLMMKMNPTLQISALMSMMLKMGTWPFHLWYMKILSLMSMKYNSFKMIMTWQKLIPMIMISYFEMSTILLMIIASTMILPTLKLKKNSSLKAIFALSSINNNGWFILSTSSSMVLMMLYFIIYSTSLIISIEFFKKINIKINPWKKNMWENFIVAANLSSIPPLPMFTSKLIIVLSLMTFFPKEMLLLMMIMSCFLSFFYLSATMNSLMKSSSKTQLLRSPNLSKESMLLILMTILSWLVLILG